MSTLLSSEALHKLEEQLTCVVCMSKYTDPRLLPCFHSFCLDCVKGVFQGNRSRSPKCPTCRSPCELPQGGVNALPPSFTINSLTEVYNLMKKAVEGHTSCDKCQKNEGYRYCKQCAKFLCQQCLQPHNEWMTNHDMLGLNELINEADQLPQTTIVNCLEHDSEPIKAYCKTCGEFVCYKCVETVHKDHDYEIVDDVYAKYRTIVQQSSLQPLNRLITVMTESIANLTQRREEITEQGENVRQLAHETIAKIKENIDKDIDGALKYKLDVTDNQKREGEGILGQLTQWRDHIRGGLAVVTPQQVLSTKAQVTGSSSLLATLNKPFIPIERANLRFVRNDDIENIGTIEYSIETMPSVTTSFDHAPMVGKVSIITVSLSLDGSPAPVPSLTSCHLTPPTSTSSPVVQCRIKRTSQTGQYRIIFTPCTGGLHRLHVQLHDCTITADVPVIVEMKIKSNIVKEIPDGSGYGVALSDDGNFILVNTNDSCITIVTREGEKLRSLESEGNEWGQLNAPEGVAVTSKSTLIVTDNGNHRIQEFTMDGECVACVGSEGNGPEQFDFPCGVAVNKVTGQVYVVDLNNRRVQVLNADLTFSYSFGSCGSNDGQFSSPCGIVIDSQGFVYVSDVISDEEGGVQKFTPEGQFVSSFTFRLPDHAYEDLLYITIQNDLLYVNFWRDGRIASVYTTSGQFVHEYLIPPMAKEIRYGFIYLLDN